MSIESKFVKSLQELGMVGGGENFGGGKFDKIKESIKKTGENIKKTGENIKADVTYALKHRKLEYTGKAITAIPKYGVKGAFGTSKLSIKGLTVLAKESFKDFVILISFIVFLVLFYFKREWFVGNNVGNAQSSVILVIMLISFIYGFHKLDILKNNESLVSRLFYYFIVVYIFHILWVILTFTNPDKLSCDMVTNRVGTCNSHGIYYGNHPTPANYANNYHDYIFDITTWFPPGFLPDNTLGYKCTACPYNQTATSLPGCSNNGNIMCRECNTNESWYSIKDINDLYNTNTPFPTEYISKEGIALIQVPTNTWDQIGVCISNKKMDEAHQNSYINDLTEYDTSYECSTYRDCLSDNRYSSNFNITIPDPTKLDPILSGQTFHFRDFAVPIQLTIPYNTDYSSCDNSSNYRTNYYYLDNDYGNPICDPNSSNKCEINIAIPSNIAEPTTSTSLPKSLLNVREGINCPSGTLNCYKNAGDCQLANKIIYNFNDSNNNTRLKQVSYNDLVGKDIPIPRSLDIEPNSDIKSENWINAIDEARETCVNTINKGTCFMNTDNYPCTTKRGTAIPLLDNNKLVIPEFSMDGCRNALLTCPNKDETCNALQVSENSYLYDKDPISGGKNGKCKPVRYDYDNNKWIIDPVATPTDLRCIPNDKINENDIINGHIFEKDYLNNIPTWIGSIQNPTLNSYSTKIPDNMCNMVRKNNTDFTGVKNDTSNYSCKSIS